MNPADAAVLGRLARGGDVEARNKLVEAHEHVARIAARKTRLSDPDVLADLRQAAHVAVIEAADKWNPDAGEFGPYAFRFAMRAVSRASFAMSGVARSGKREHRRFVRASQARRKVARTLPEDMHVSAVAKAIGESAESVARVLVTDAPLDEMAEMFDDFDTEGAALDRAEVARNLAKLTEREREVIALRFGLDGEGERNIDVIAKRCGMSWSMTRRTIEGALSRLRAAPPPESTGEAVA